jgi:hypothetical protein
VTAGADWLAVAESAEPEGSRALDAAAAVWLFAAGIVLARPAVVAPTPSSNAASDQFDNRRTRRSPLSRGKRGGLGFEVAGEPGNRVLVRSG